MTEPAARPWLKGYVPGIAWDMEFPAHPLTRFLDESVERFPDRPCLDFLGKIYSYREVGDLVRRAAQGLAGLGVGAGVRVGLMLPNTPYYVIAYFAVLRAGGTVVNINPLYVEREIRHLVADAGCRIVVTLDLKLTYNVLETMRDGQSAGDVDRLPNGGDLAVPQERTFSRLQAQRSRQGRS